MKLSLVATAFGLISAAAGRRFERTLDAETRTVRTSSSGTNVRTLFLRPVNTTFDMKTEAGIYTNTYPFVRTLVFNKTTDTSALFGYRVGVLRLAELEANMDARNATNIWNLNRK